MKKLEIGTKVFDVRFGWGEVSRYQENTFCVMFGQVLQSYEYNGKWSVYDINPTLSLTEYSLEKGGFTPIDTEPPLQVGELAFFYFHNGTHLHYSAIADINNDCNGNPIKYFTVCGYTFDYASREIPQWFLDKFQNK
jgi:hypothetical protein